MDDLNKLVTEYSKKAIKEHRKDERYRNRFNYYGIIIAALTLIVSIITIILKVY